MLKPLRECVGNMPNDSTKLVRFRKYMKMPRTGNLVWMCMQMCKMASHTSLSSPGASWAGFFDGGDLSEADRLPGTRGMVYDLLIISNGTGGSGLGRGHADTKNRHGGLFI